MARKILLADDSVTAQNMGRRILSDAGYEVVTVNNGSAALKKIAESKPDLIILDVYMPGYGGLEVCQRLKEAPETARIPVLLSVGKLEPFKVEESRRVRADGFIIKPFEASELLTALTKLEDKIVPQADSFKPGRFAKAIASAEQLSTSSQAVEDSGWKSRLTIPAATPKSEEAGTQEPQPDGPGLRDAAQHEESKSIAMKSAEIAAALPPGITAEELAALAAAANAFAGHSEPIATKTEEPEKVKVAEKPETLVEAKTETSTVEIAEAVTFASSPVQEPAQQNDAQPEARKELQTPAQAAELERATSDAEVLAALASLSPSHHEATETASGNGNHSGVHHAQQDSAGASGPRWIAQAVAIADDESALVLEREMEKAYAAMAALEAEKNSVAVAEATVEPMAKSVEAPPAIEISAATEQPQLAEPVPAVPESVPEISSPEAAAAIPAAIEDVTAVSETTVAVSTEHAAYAAAASAGSGISEQIESSSTATEVPSVVENIAAPVEVDPGRESELAAAWQNWKQIRESIAGSNSAPPKAETAIQNIEREEQTAVEPDEDAASDSSGEEISSIVDTMLAELKPKLMEEISKKMGKSKDKKKR